ncbi:DUF4214 domain-containing protein [uncultured Ruminococcus sp.]|uniref:DUF4214 domain-containing protein n=1 Tax=uncultured Ruminococcus sp. TaxID=165186 RepID=UPI002615E4F3|nr:DUF4214 domain-containing protein [uncultured Ruminococcus sp.]
MKTKKLAGLLSAAVLASSCTSAIACQTASAKELSSASIAYDINTPAADVTGTAYAKTAEGFVQRMYNVALNRNADAAGLKNWTSQLKSGKKTAADLIDGFFFSDEYKGKKKSADEMIADCYKAMLDRSPDATGKANWKLRFNVGMSMQAICKGFVGSNEFKGLCKTYGIKPGTINLRLAKDENYERTAFVYRLYNNCLYRTPDGAGLENWCKQIKSGKTGSQVGYGFVFSNEHMSLIQKDYNVVKNYITDLYRAFLGREPDSAGLENWDTSIVIGSNSLQYVFNGFLMSNEFKQQCAKAGIKVGNKLADPNELNVSDYPAKILNGINKERAKKGIAPLKTHPALEQYLKELDNYYYVDMDAKAPDIYKAGEACGIERSKLKSNWIKPLTQCAHFSFEGKGFKYTYTTAEDLVKDLTEGNPSDPTSFSSLTLDSQYKYAALSARVGKTTSLDSYYIFYEILLIG